MLLIRIIKFRRHLVIMKKDFPNMIVNSKFAFQTQLNPYAKRLSLSEKPKSLFIIIQENRQLKKLKLLRYLELVRCLSWISYKKVLKTKKIKSKHQNPAVLRQIYNKPQFISRLI